MEYACNYGRYRGTPSVCRGVEVKRHALGHMERLSTSANAQLKIRERVRENKQYGYTVIISLLQLKLN